LTVPGTEGKKTTVETKISAPRADEEDIDSDSEQKETDEALKTERLTKFSTAAPQTEIPEQNSVINSDGGEQTTDQAILTTIPEKDSKISSVDVTTNQAITGVLSSE